jgi:hypothetical protein
MFSILRTETAMTPLQSAWETYDDQLREAILQASSRIDKQLISEPHRRGESRGEGTRVLFESPLGIEYDVDEAKQLVRILRLWAYRTRADRVQGEE